MKEAPNIRITNTFDRPLVIQREGFVPQVINPDCTGYIADKGMVNGVKLTLGMFPSLAPRRTDGDADVEG